MFSSLPLIFPSTVLGNITASVALILWTNGQLPPPIKELWEGLKKLAPHHFSPGASCEHSRGRKIFGLLNCFYASIVSLVLSLSNWLLSSNQMGGRMSQDQVWALYLLGFKVGMERGPSPLLSNCHDVPASPRTPKSRDLTDHGQSPKGQAKVWAAGEGWGVARNEPSLLWVLRVCWPLEAGCC